LIPTEQLQKESPKELADRARDLLAANPAQMLKKGGQIRAQFSRLLNAFRDDPEKLNAFFSHSLLNEDVGAKRLKKMGNEVVGEFNEVAEANRIDSTRSDGFRQVARRLAATSGEARKGSFRQIYSAEEA